MKLKCFLQYGISSAIGVEVIRAAARRNQGKAWAAV